MNRKVFSTLSLAFGLLAQPVAGQTWYWFEAGLGVGSVGEGGGLNGRLALGLLSGRWGGMARATIHDGGEGVTEPGFFSGLFGPPHETFEEVSVLLTRSLRAGTDNAVLIGLGVGTMSGRRIDSTDGIGLEDLKPTWGVPFELAIHGGDGRGIGGSLVLSGHLNAEAPQVGLGLAVSLGRITGGAG